MCKNAENKLENYGSLQISSDLVRSHHHHIQTYKEWKPQTSNILLLIGIKIYVDVGLSVNIKILTSYFGKDSFTTNLEQRANVIEIVLNLWIIFLLHTMTIKHLIVIWLVYI